MKMGHGKARLTVNFSLGGPHKKNSTLLYLHRIDTKAHLTVTIQKIDIFLGHHKTLKEGL